MYWLHNTQNVPWFASNYILACTIPNLNWLYDLELDWLVNELQARQNIEIRVTTTFMSQKILKLPMIVSIYNLTIISNMLATLSILYSFPVYMLSLYDNKLKCKFDELNLASIDWHLSGWKIISMSLSLPVSSFH